MRNPARSNAACTKPRWGGSILALLTLAALAICFAAFELGCTAEKRYKVLSFFFDGVPDPNAPKVAVDSSGNPLTRPGALPGITVVLHKPYADNNCGACHESATGTYEQFTKLPPEVCLKCHAKVPSEYTIMHGPVSAGECLLCHTPHESSIAHLLKDPPPGVCTQCHVSELLPKEPADHLTNRSCLDCHTAHGGEKHGLLRAGVALTAGATTRGAAP
jgi:predicted CXXCH cytochrome family protein